MKFHELEFFRMKNQRQYFGKKMFHLFNCYYTANMRLSFKCFNNLSMYVEKISEILWMQLLLI